MVRNLLLGLLLVGVLSPSFSLAQSPAVPVADREIVLGEPSQQSLKEFRKSLIKAAEQAFEDNEISRMDLIKVRFASRSNRVLKEMHQACAEQCLADGVCGSYEAIDWQKLVDFIKVILPIILQLIALFA
jgi:hypothetical protein